MFAGLNAGQWKGASAKPARKCNCGRGCTRSDYDAAVLAGKDLRRRLGGARAGWKLDVWDNLGWHAAVRRGPLSVYQHKDRDGRVRYTALLNGRPGESHGGAAYWTEQGGSGHDPVRVIERQRKIALQFIRRSQAAISAAYPDTPKRKVRR